MNNNARNPIPEELHVYRHDEGIGNGTTPAGVEWLDGWCSIAIDISPRWGVQFRRNNQVMERGFIQIWFIRFTKDPFHFQI